MRSFQKRKSKKLMLQISYQKQRLFFFDTRDKMIFFMFLFWNESSIHNTRKKCIRAVMIGT